MKKILCLILAALMLCAMLTACTEDNKPTDPKPTETKPAPTETKPAPTEPAPTTPPTEPAPKNTVINVADYFDKDDKWEDDGGEHKREAGKIHFDNFMAGDYCALRLKEEAKNVTYKFKVTISELAPVSMDDWTWWDSEIAIIARSTLPASSWQEDGSQKGYTLTSWGDMKSVFIGRCGYDDAFGEFQWNVNDGKPHDIELTVENNDDNTQVTITLVVDGEQIASVVDDGSKVKEERPNLYPDAGGLTIRCKWLDATIE